jgi:hypothetical protein
MSLLQMTQSMIMDQFDLRRVTNHELVVQQFRTNHFHEKLSHFNIGDMWSLFLQSSIQGPTWTTLAAGECRYLSNGLVVVVKLWFLVLLSQIHQLPS